MAPREFLVEVVRPNVADFDLNYGSMRHAFNAVASVDALAGRLYQWCKAHNPSGTRGSTGDSGYRGELATASNAFRLIRDLAKAQKHAVLTQFTPLLTDANQTVRRAINLGEFRLGDSRLGSDCYQVIVELAPGDIRHVDAAVRDALAFLEAEMSQVGVP